LEDADRLLTDEDIDKYYASERYAKPSALLQDEGRGGGGGGCGCVGGGGGGGGGGCGAGERDDDDHDDDGDDGKEDNNNTSKHQRDMDTHAMARNHIVTEIVLHNACRTGPLINMTVDEFARATTTTTTGPDAYFVVRVVEHKTFMTYGHAPLVFPKSVMDKARVYQKRFRPKGGTCDKFFLTWRGQSMSSTTVGDILSRELNRTKMTCTLFRKSAVTQFLQADSDSKSAGKLAKLMRHSTEMQKTVYDVDDSDQCLIKASQLVSNAFNCAERNKNDVCKLGQKHNTQTVPAVAGKIDPVVVLERIHYYSKF
jgi:hypothetical protein